ncbi:MAG: response regulator transcription factor [Pyrinomonadaceae bacterium]
MFVSFRDFVRHKIRRRKTIKIHDHLRVLYAEDNEDASYMMTVLLGLSEIKIIAAKNVAEAWRLARAEHFDLYLLDSRFPDGDGFELCRRLREHAPPTPILFYSGDARETDKQKGLAAGADAYLVKPNSDEIVSTILYPSTCRTRRNSQNEKNIADVSRRVAVKLSISEFQIGSLITSTKLDEACA